MLQEGITEAGGLAELTAAATAGHTWDTAVVPFFTYYSMFGFQRVGDLIWALADARGRGFLVGATAGRTTLAGEGMQHTDGSSHLAALAVPSCRAYDPAFAYETAADRPRRHPAHVRRRRGVLLLPDRLQRGSRPAGQTHRLRRSRDERRRGDRRRPLPRRPGRCTARRRCGCSPPVRRSARRNRRRRTWPTAPGIAAEVWSVTSWKQLRDDALDGRAVERRPPGRASAGQSPTARTRRSADPDRRGQRLRQRAARPARPVHRRTLRQPRHRRLRDLRHPGGTARPLRRGRRCPYRGRPRPGPVSRRGNGRGAGGRGGRPPSLRL